MYIFSNIFKNIRTYKNRNILMFIVIFIMSLLCCISLIVWQATKRYESINTELMNISVDFGTEVSSNTVLLLQETLGTRIFFGSSPNQSPDMVAQLRNLVVSEDLYVSYDILTAYFLGSDNFRSHILDLNLELIKTKIATAFTDNQYISVVRADTEVFLDAVDRDLLRLEDGDYYTDDSLEYECIIDEAFAHRRNLKIGDTLDVYFDNQKYGLKITGIYTSIYIKTFGDNAKFVFLGKTNYELDYYFPSVYVNRPFYEEIQEVESMNLELVMNVVGLPSDEAMTDFVNGKATITYGKVFDPSEDTYECVISEQIARKNELKVGDEIVLRGRFEDSKEYPVKIVGLYSSATHNLMGTVYRNPSIRMNEMPLDTVYMSFSALSKIIDDIDSYKDIPYEKLMNLKIAFKDTKELNSFYKYAINQDFKIGNEFVTVTEDAKEYFNKLTMIKRTTSYALIIFVIELLISIIFLILFNAFNLRERQYEIGVLASMGMSKNKIAVQFFSEIVIVVMSAVLIGTALGSFTTNIVGDYLTKQHVANIEEQKNAFIENFGRETSVLKLDDIDKLAIDASISPIILALLFGAFMLVVVVSTSGTTRFILSFEPIAILNDRY